MEKTHANIEKTVKHVFAAGERDINPARLMAWGRSFIVSSPRRLEGVTSHTYSANMNVLLL